MSAAACLEKAKSSAHSERRDASSEREKEGARWDKTSEAKKEQASKVQWMRVRNVRGCHWDSCDSRLWKPFRNGCLTTCLGRIHRLKHTEGQA